MKGNGMDHHRLDSNEASLLKNITPVLVPDSTMPYDEPVQQFTEHAVDRDRELYTLVLWKLSESTGKLMRDHSLIEDCISLPGGCPVDMAIRLILLTRG
jgi:hypothetical protein